MENINNTNDITIDPTFILMDNTVQNIAVNEIHTFDETDSKRRRLTAHETTTLSLYFEQTQRPTPQLRKLIAEQLNMPERTVQVWFQNSNNC